MGVLSGINISRTAGTTFLSSLCDGKYDCKDHSDESLQECIKKHWNDVLALMTTVSFVFIIGATLCYVVNTKNVIIKCYGRSALLDMHNKAVHSREFELSSE